MDIEDTEQPMPQVSPFQIPLAFVAKARFAELNGKAVGIVEAQADRAMLLK